MSDSGGPFSALYAIVSIFVAYFTLIEPILWGMAGAVSYPFNYLAMAIVAWLTFSGVVALAVIAVLLIILVLFIAIAGLGGFAKFIDWVR